MLLSQTHPSLFVPLRPPPPRPAQVFEVRAKTTLMYAALAFVASLGAMEAGSMARGLLDWPVDFEETANQFDAGSFALPTRFEAVSRVELRIILCPGWFGFAAWRLDVVVFFARVATAGRGGGGGSGPRRWLLFGRFLLRIWPRGWLVSNFWPQARHIGVPRDVRRGFCPEPFMDAMNVMLMF